MKKCENKNEIREKDGEWETKGEAYWPFHY